MLVLSCLCIIVAVNFPFVMGKACGHSCRQSYQATCGNLLKGFRCTEHRQITCYRCCEGWTGTISGSSGCDTPKCGGEVNNCPNGGTCSTPDVCTNCNQGYYSPKCDACADIEHCVNEVCTTATDQTCVSCEGDFGPTNGAAYRKSNDQRSCIKQCSWRDDSNACYPGSCINAQCRCSNGFSGRDCRTLGSSQSPVLSEYRGTLIMGPTQLESPTIQGSTDTVYTNKRDFASIKINWKSSYQPSGLPDPNGGGLPYIDSVGLGIVGAAVSAHVNKARGGTYSIASRTCSNAGSELAPRKDLVDCEYEFNIDYNSWTPTTGDVLRYNVNARNGGFLKLHNRDYVYIGWPINAGNGEEYYTRMYSSRSTSAYATFTFDFVDPYHCVDVGSGCRTTMLYAGSDVTSQTTVSITWQGWADDLAGIKEYDLQVRQLSGMHGTEMAEIFDSPAVYFDVTTSGQRITFPRVGVYSIILTVVDNAGNTKLSRRFVFFDNDPNDVTIKTDGPLRVTSATAETDHVWLIDLEQSGGTTSVNLLWMNHFINEHHVNQGLLKPIGSYISGTIYSDYDQNFGQRGRAAIPHTLGVTQFRVLHDIDHSGGTSTVTVSDNNSDSWSNEGTNTQATYNLNLVDGDSIRFWVEARDIAGHFVRDSVLIQADSSPPIIEDFWLVRDGEVNVAVHSSVDLHEMSVVFRTYDIHSGVRTIEWRLYDNREREYGHQTVPARKIDTDTATCDPVSCMCIPIGECYAVDYGFNPTFHIGAHDYDYFITLTVTNHARLRTTKTIKITVDTSPPQAGVVHDGIRGSNEVDYQEGSDLSAHWEGFFDKESGVKFYQFLFDDLCWNDTTMIGTVKDYMTRTTSTHASWTAPSPGLYYVTVIAYNRALEASDPVCSDGVVIDTSPPELSQIVISNARMWPGLARDAEGRVWFMNEYRMKTELVNASSDCSSKATLIDDLSVYPGRDGFNDSLVILKGDVDCRWISGIEEKFYLPTHKRVTISWTGEDTASSIFDYEIGLSSDPSNPTPDLVTFRSTSGHNHFVMYHPHISQGSVFHMVLKAANRAQLSTTKVIGPIIVDTTPPMFVGHVLVHAEDGYLIAEWGDGFIDDEDTGLAYQVGIGSSLGGTETLAFQMEQVYKIGLCLSRTSCAAFSLADLDWHLHGDHEYYVSIRALNGAGLATIGTSSVYRHIIQLPSRGVVLDVAPPGEEVVVFLGVAKDIDVQMNTTSISARWFGFEHPHLEISYEIAIGSGGGGSSDVSSGFIDVGNATYYRMEGLNLTPLKTYYVTVRANSDAGSVTVTSDGVKVIQEGQILAGASIKDGLGCDQDGTSPSSGLSHHSSAPHQPCEDDTTYQSSTSDISARWTIPELLQPFVTNILWSVEQEVEINQADEDAATEWITLLDYQDLGMAFQHVGADMGLHAGAHYRSKVQFCHVGVCFQPIITDGFWVLSNPAEVGGVTVSNIGTVGSSTEMHVVFQPFTHDYVRHNDPQELMDFYEWSIAEDGSDSAVLSQWTRIEDLVVSGQVARFTASYSGHLDHDVCLRLSVRGYNKAGLSSIASTEIVDCDDVTLVVPHLVIDADYVTLEENAAWPLPDNNYISSTTSLSAVWPTLRHGAYTWAAIEDIGSTEYGNLDNGLQYPCDHPLAKACGDIDKEFVNIYDLSLEHGKRYRICIHADEVTLEHEVWSETLSSVSSCSDGVVIDITPPTFSSVWIGWNRHQIYQSSSSELVIHWESFIDVEENGLARHHSGIKYYEYAIGSMQGGSDVKEFTRVGITNNVIVHNLRLQNGHIYYATIRATDFVGLSAVAMSDSVTIDTSPPVISANHTLNVGGSFIRSTTSILASWENVFSDRESGIAYYEWAVGSHPGHADIMPFTRENSESGVTDPSQPLTLQEGHSYFVSVKAINTVGLITLKSFGAFTVDASPPLAGHVFDGDPAIAPANHRDRDFQEDHTMLSAFWEGFHDPHSVILGYSWQAGICKGCDDVIPKQNIGLDTYVLAANLNLVPGLTYYVTVMTCNAADLCTSVTSDGVMVDDSPPVPGRVHDGSPGGGDISFQSSRIQLSSHWWGFHDPHSGLSHYEWRAGTTPEADDILSSTRIELSEDAMIFLSEPNQMPLGTDIYITVRAYNLLGMWSEATSNGFRVDPSPPDVVDALAVDQTVGMVVSNTQVLCDLLRFFWKFTDPESGIKDQYVSVNTHHDGDINIPPMKIAGSERDLTLTNLTLHEGSRYVITVVACNFAGLCTETKAEPLLVDGSPPSIGTFAVGTESAANLQRHHIVWITPTEPSMVGTTLSSLHHHSGWMTWLEDTTTSTSSLALAWLGFADVHSGINHYFVSVGSTYGGSELTPNGPVRVNHSNSGMSLDEGIAQTAIIPLEGSIAGLTSPYLYISIWAVNGVGIPSGRHHSTFEASSTSNNEGALVLLRRCPPATCEGHCACAPIDSICTTTTGPCNNLTNSNPNTEIEVLDLLDLKFDTLDTIDDVDHTATQYMMSAVWQVTVQKGLSIKWYEWSIGDDSSSLSEPVGVFDPAAERVWFDVGQDNHIVIMIDKDRKLMAGVMYHIFIRAWYDSDTYAVFRSNGITPDVTMPRIATVKGTKVKDLARAYSTKDTDYLTDPNIVYISWGGAFLDSAMSHYQVSLSTYRGGEDIRRFADHTFLVGNSTTQFAGLDLQNGLRYYSNVRAFNKAGLHTLRSSDGFVVDARRPDPGLVFDGKDLHDVEYQNSSILISASWHGFVDLESYIDHYEWCVGQTPDPGEDSILPCNDVGVHVSTSKTLQVSLTDGVLYYSKISAIDAAGLQSASVSSDGFVVDTTPPEPQEHILLGDNIIQNPSFEKVEKPDNTDVEVSTVSVENTTLDENSTATAMSETQSNNESSVASSPESSTTGSTNGNVSDIYPTATSLTTATPTTTVGAADDTLPIPVPWVIGSTSHFTVVLSGKQIAKNGHSFLSLHGSISQTFSTTPGQHYLVIIFTSHAVPSHDPLLSQEGRIEAPGLNRIFRLYDRPAHGHADQSLRSIKWHEHRFYFTASEDVSRITISSVGRSNGILLDNVQVRLITTALSTGDGSVEVHTQFIHSWSSIQAKWHFIDPESPIVDHSWAIGTIRGGTQLQSFTSVGTQTDAINTDLSMAHGSYVYITVTARNAAGLIAIATSDPILIDLTPPIMHYVVDGGDGQDVDFSADDISLTFSWSVSDPESGIEHCEWAIGSKSGLDDIIPNSPTPDATSSLTANLSQAMVEGQNLFVTIICYNHAEQSSWKSSDGVTIVTKPPSVVAAIVNVKTESETQYETRGGYQSQRDSLKGSWDGFADPFGIQYYECLLSGPRSSVTSWTLCGFASETHLDWSGLSLIDDSTYSLSVRAINHAGLASQAISGNFTVESSKPASGAASIITTTWLGDGVVDLSWDGLFSSSTPSSLVYEVSLGTIPGGSDIMQWVETMETGMRVSPLEQHTDYHLTVTAINASGLSQTVTKIINDG